MKHTDRWKKYSTTNAMGKSQKHHILSSRKTWDSQEATKRLRGEHWLQPNLVPDYHTEIHRLVPFVPVPSNAMACLIIKNFHPVEGNYLATIDGLMLSIDTLNNHFRTGSIERGVGELMLQSIDLQVPLIREGLWNGRK